MDHPPRIASYDVCVRNVWALARRMHGKEVLWYASSLFSKSSAIETLWLPSITINEIFRVFLSKELVALILAALRGDRLNPEVGIKSRS